MKPTVGLLLVGRYRLVSQIAVGGMGEVWVAHDESLARDVAVKVLRAEFAGNQDFLDRLRTEARNAAGLSHTNIAQLYDYGEQEGSGFLVMELITGEPMSDLLEREPILKPHRLLPILSQTARGLHAAHVGGVVHRDVKPGNILLEGGTIVKITDFGVSLAANQVPMTATGMVMGTAQYLSPEQAIGRAATGASDIYALGIVAYESVIGHRPFTGPTAVDIAVAHVNQTVPPLPKTVHGDLAELIMQMLDKDPTKRPRSGASLASVLDELATNMEEDPFSRRTIGRRGISSSSVSSAPSASTATSPRSAAVPPVPAPPVLRVPSPPRPPASAPATPIPGKGTAATGTGHPSAKGASRPVPRPPGPADRSASAPGEQSRSAPRPSGEYPMFDPVTIGPPTRRRTLPTARTGTQASPRTAPNPPGTSRSRPNHGPQQARRANLTTGQRFGRFSWPLIGLVGLLIFLLAAALVSHFTKDTGSGTASAITHSRVQDPSDNQTLDTKIAGNGMIRGFVSHSILEIAAPTTPKDE